MKTKRKWVRPQFIKTFRRALYGGLRPSVIFIGTQIVDEFFKWQIVNFSFHLCIRTVSHQRHLFYFYYARNIWKSVKLVNIYLFSQISDYNTRHLVSFTYHHYFVIAGFCLFSQSLSLSQHTCNIYSLQKTHPPSTQKKKNECIKLNRNRRNS